MAFYMQMWVSFRLEKAGQILITVMGIPDCILVLQISFPVALICK